MKTPAQVATTVIAEINERMPRTLGDSFIHFSKIDHAIPVDYPLAELPMGETNELSMKIGEFVASLIEDESTMQMGIGAIPDAVLNFLDDKQDLGVHTELFSDGVMDLVQKGVITNERKTLHQGNRIDSEFVLDMGLADVRYSIIHYFYSDKNRLTWILDKDKPKDYITKTTGYWQLEA